MVCYQVSIRYCRSYTFCCLSILYCCINIIFFYNNYKKENAFQTTKSFLNQLVDVIQEDISGSSTRKTYQVFVTGGIGPGITSSLFQTVYDQDFSLQTANPVFDITVGIFSGSITGVNRMSDWLLIPQFL